MTLFKQRSQENGIASVLIIWNLSCKPSSEDLGSWDSEGLSTSSKLWTPSNRGSRCARSRETTNVSNLHVRTMKKSTDDLGSEKDYRIGGNVPHECVAAILESL